MILSNCICGFFMNKDINFSELLRFTFVGGISTIVNYGAYLLFLLFLSPSVAFLLAYLFAFVVNYILTTVFTFKVKATKKNGAGFLATNIANFFLNEFFLNIFVEKSCI